MKKLWGVISVLIVGTLLFAQTTTITIVATTDGHGFITGYDYVNDKELNYGLPYAAKVIKKLRKENKNLILADIGDTISGAPITFYHAYYKKGQPNPVIKCMNELKYDIATIGNHDFDFGAPYLTKAITQSSFPWVSANVYEGNFPFSYSYRIIEKGGVKVGFFGLTTPATKYFEPPFNIKGLDFKKMAENAQKAVDDLKRNGADIIVALCHSGKGPMYDLSEPFENALYYVLEHVKGIDIAFYGHSHKENPIEYYNKVLICQPKNYYQSVAVAIIDLQKRDGHWEILNKASTVLSEKDKLDKTIVKLSKSIASDLEDFLNKKIGKYPDQIELKQIYADPGSGIDILYKAQKSAIKADAYFVQFSYDNLVKPEGKPLRIKHAFKLLPYDNYLVKTEITGKNLKLFLEKNASYFDSSGTLEPDAKPFYASIGKNIKYTVNFKRPKNHRIKIEKVNGKEFKEDGVYSVVLTAYTYTENLDFFNKDKTTYSEKSFRQILINYLQNEYGKEE